MEDPWLSFSFSALNKLSHSLPASVVSGRKSPCVTVSDSHSEWAGVLGSSICAGVEPHSMSRKRVEERSPQFQMCLLGIKNLQHRAEGMRNAGGLYLLNRNQGPRLRAGEWKGVLSFFGHLLGVDTRHSELGEGCRREASYGSDATDWLVFPRSSRFFWINVPPFAVCH